MGRQGVERLIFVGGVSGVGKSRLIREIRQEKCPQLCRQLDIGDPEDWYYVSMKRTSLASARQLVVHYDLNNRSAFKDVTALMTAVDHTLALTLRAPFRILIQRKIKRLACTLCGLLVHPKNFAASMHIVRRDWRHLVGKRFHPEAVAALENEWFCTLNEHRVANYLLDTTESGTPRARLCVLTAAPRHLITLSDQSPQEPSCLPQMEQRPPSSRAA